MFPAVYPVYLVLIAWALLRRRRRALEAGRSREWRLAATAMIALPFAMAGAALLVAWQTENATALITSFYGIGAFLLAAGLVSARLVDSKWPLVLRLAGWGLIAGLTIIPSTLVLLLPLVSLLAFVVPNGYRRGQRAHATA